MKAKFSLSLGILFLTVMIFFLVSYLNSPKVKTDKIRAGQKMQAYGLESVPLSDFTKIAKNLLVNLVVVEINPGDSPSNWQKIFAEARRNNWQVIIRLTPQPWQWIGKPKDEESGQWNLDKGEEFLNFLNEYLKSQQNIFFALYLLNDPFWQGNFSLGYSSAVQKKLYQEIKRKVPQVNLITDVGSLTFWENYSWQTKIENGMFDYAGIWLYPFHEAGKPDDVLMRIEEEVKLIEKKKLSLGLVFKIQAFSQTAMASYNPPYQEGNNFSLPMALALRNFACQVVGSNKIEVVLYHSWKNDLYRDYLANHPELWPDVNWVLANCQPS